MKIIVAYASAGAGHFKAAEAIYNCFKEKHKEVDIRLIDVLDHSTSFFRFIYTSGYNILINHAVFLWKVAFYSTENRLLRRVSRSVARLIHRLNTGRFSNILISEKPDYIISTHFLTSEVPALLKKSGKINSVLITVITDFGVHPFWLSEGTDTYIAASEFTKKQLMAEGVREDIIKVLGIPVDPKFLRPCDRKNLCKKLGIDKDKFTVLIITGSFGIGPIEEVVDILHNDAQLLVVCAKNKGIYKKLKKKKYPGCVIFGFINNAQELMAVSDVIITKPGGLTSSEVLTMGIAPVFISTIPGQETVNVRALESYGVGIRVDNLKQIHDIVTGYKEHPERLKQIKEKMNAIKKPFAAEEICNVICKGSLGPSC